MQPPVDKQKEREELVDKLYKIMSHGCSIKHSMPIITRDRQLVLFVMTERGSQLQYTSYELQKDVDIVVAAINSNRKAVKYVSDMSLLCYPAVIKVLAKSVIGSPLKFLKNVLAAEFPVNDGVSVAKKYNMSKIARIVHYSTHLKHDELFMLFAVNVDGCVLEFAGRKIRDNIEITTAASMQNPLSLKYASRRIQKSLGLLDILWRYDSNRSGSDIVNNTSVVGSSRFGKDWKIGDDELEETIKNKEEMGIGRLRLTRKKTW